MATGRIDESQVSASEEQEVFADFTIEEIGNIQQLVNTVRTKLALECGWRDQRLFRATATRRGKQFIPMFSYMLARKKATENLLPKKTG